MDYYTMADIERIGAAGCLRHMNSLHEMNRRLEAQLEDAQKATAEFDRLRLLACQEVERIAPEARESQALRFDVCQMLDQRDTLREELARARRRIDQMREEFAALAGCARDNNWQGVSEGLHAYAWQAFLDTNTGRADQTRRWASVWKQAARSRRSARGRH